MAYIYKITNLLNGKIYVGKRIRENASDMEKYYGSGIAIKLAIQKYGKENFKKEVLEKVEDKNLLGERERFWIAKLDAQNPEIGYNLSPGGDGGCTIASAKKGAETRQQRGYQHSEETKKKISEAHKGQKFSDEHKHNLSLNHHLRTLHRILFENSNEIIETYMPYTEIAKKYLGASGKAKSLRLFSSQDRFYCGIKLLECIGKEYKV